MFEVLQKPSCIVDKHPDFNPILKLVWLWMQKEKKKKQQHEAEGNSLSRR